ncbi:hypothetical protein WJX74_003125 [Apatococcus lobatus]|uniref:RRM domain-containing protein n=2 Tax=Apatococcus TaxID=904362 RepID=A0AAW1SYX2_9CHLO
MGDFEAEMARFEAELAGGQAPPGPQQMNGGPQRGSLPPPPMMSHSMPPGIPPPPPMMAQQPPPMHSQPGHSSAPQWPGGSMPMASAPQQQQQQQQYPAYSPPPQQAFQQPPPASQQPSYAPPAYPTPPQQQQQQYAPPAAAAYQQPQQALYGQPAGVPAQAPAHQELNPHSLYVQQLFSEQTGRGAGKSAPGHMGKEQPSQEKLADIKAAFEKEKKGKIKQKAVPRLAGGEKWWDSSLLEWPENDFRIFVGDLGNETNDDVLAKAFHKYTACQKAKVVRDKRTNKTKGYGFVSFNDPIEGAKALREMNGKYIGNRPCKLRRSNWEERINEEALAKKRKGPATQGQKPKRPSILHK